MRNDNPDFLPAVLQIVLRTSIPIALATFAVCMAARAPASAHRIGTHAIVFDKQRAEAFLHKETKNRISIVDFGLEDGRGLAYLEEHVYVADAWDAIYDCQIKREGTGEDERVTCIEDTST